MDKKLITEIARSYGLRVYFFHDVSDKRGGGFHRVSKVRGALRESIHLNTDCNNWKSILFHEIGHAYCTFAKKFPTYHRLKGGRWVNERYHFSIKGLRDMLRTGYRAERFVDRWAQKEMAYWFPEEKYFGGYSDPSSKIWYDTFYLNRFRDLLHYKIKKNAKRNRRLN